MPDDDTWEPRKWQYPNPGRFDVNGIEWWACDPYPTFYRWEEGELFLNHARWAEPEVNDDPVGDEEDMPMQIVCVTCDDGWDGVYVDGKLIVEGHGHGVRTPAVEALKDAGLDIRSAFSNFPDDYGSWPEDIKTIPDLHYDN